MYYKLPRELRDLLLQYLGSRIVEDASAVPTTLWNRVLSVEPLPLEKPKRKRRSKATEEPKKEK